MRFLPGNAQHIGARHSQQDSFGFSDPADEAFIAHGGFLAIVCDGMGGMEFGDEASRLAVKAFLDAYSRKTADENIPAALERSVREANAQVVELATRLGMKDGVGTTLVAAALHQKSMYYISVGDSGVFLCAPGECRMINRAHVFANVLDAAVARGTMSREDAQTHPERESLTSYIGTDQLEEIDRNIEPYPMHDGDTVLLASDGMFKTLSPEEIRACLAGDPQRWAEVLVAQTMAHKREYQDNVTVVSVTASDDLAQTMPTRTMKPAAIPIPAAPIPPPPPLKPPPPQAAALQPAPSQPAVEWPSGEHAAVPTPPSRSSPLWLLVVLLVIVAAGAAGWWYAKHVRPNRPGAAGSESPKAEDLPALRADPPAGLTPVGATGANPQDKPPDQNPDGSPADPDDGPPPPGAPGGPPPVRRGPPPAGAPMQPLSDPVRKPEVKQ